MLSARGWLFPIGITALALNQNQDNPHQWVLCQHEGRLQTRADSPENSNASKARSHLSAKMLIQ